jgi:hypothetical protein
VKICSMLHAVLNYVNIYMYKTTELRVVGCIVEELEVML